ncbi:hypothetical protein JKF63_06929 [Porcisia hertigi]|uniref:Uncharacterized protein n=1 Tax=Porcisia hertigi TaxID=2761500 RepID=A0A837A9D4_9TRYP|nr:hypothetical protein JKF63_06929 [Porcisia hertigi]
MITIISSDGQTFALSPSTIAHSGLLEDALRRWTDAYQTNVKRQTSATKNAIATLRTPTEMDDDDDATADDLEETPDEHYIACFYGETGCDLTVTSGALEGVGSGGVDIGDTVSEKQEHLHLIRMASALTGDDMTAHQPNEVSSLLEIATLEKGTAAARGGCGDAEQDARRADNEDSDSDRTTSVLPSSAEGSMSRTSTPFKTNSNCSTPTRTSDSAGVAIEATGASHATNAFLWGVPIQALSPAKRVAASWHPLENAGSRSRSVDDTHAEGAAGVLGMNEATINTCVSRPLAPVTHVSPNGDGPHVSPSMMIDPDMSTPSVLGSDEVGDGEEEEEEKEQGDGGCVTYAVGGNRPSRDPRSLGGEELNSAATASSSPGLPPCSPDMNTAGVPNGGKAPHHHDPLSVQHHILPAGGQNVNRRRGSAVVQAGAAEDDDSDGNVKRDTHKAGVEVTSDAAHEVAVPSTVTAHSGSGLFSMPTPPLDWSPPSSCHQRTPCMADEDDVGAMLCEDEIDADGSTPSGVEPSHTDTVGGTSPCSKPPLAHGTGGTATAPVPSQADLASLVSLTAPITPVGGAEVAPLSTVANGAEPEDTTDSLARSFFYADGIRITSSGIVFNLAQPAPPLSSASTSIVSTSPPPRNEAVQQSDSSRLAGGAATPAQLTPCASPGCDEAAARTTVDIDSFTLQVCIKYMKHFSRVQAAAAIAAARGKRRKHQRRRYGSSSSEDSGKDDNSATSSPSSATRSGTYSDCSDDDTDKASTISDASFNAKVDGPSPGSPGLKGSGAGKEEGEGASDGTLRRTSPSPSVLSSCEPALIPEPLTTPLVAFLSPWERVFLYVDVLGAPETMLAASLLILDICPGFDYCSPSMHMRDARVKTALMLPPPPPEGMQKLMKVMAGAKVLQIAPLYALCAGWLADFMIRASYGAANNFEAAHLIRQCLCLPSDWSRRETDCLKIENEWPANEEAD